MPDARLTVQFAGPFVTFQDAGRPGHLRHGVPASGPMDRLAYAAALSALGNPAGSTCIEISLGGLILTCADAPVSFALTGGHFAVDHAGTALDSWTIQTLEPGEKLTIRAGASGSWAYLAFAGDLQSPKWLDHSATHALSGFGGGPVVSGATLTVANAEPRPARVGEIAPAPYVPNGPFSVVLGPQDHHFTQASQKALFAETFAVSDAYDRMGMRLAGTTLNHGNALSIPSEPVLRGAVQVPGDGMPTVLLADHQTTGGYPKIATIVTPDLDRLVQLRSGDTLRFAQITPAAAIHKAREEHATRAAYLDRIATARGTLEDRLMRENLIHGFHEEF